MALLMLSAVTTMQGRVDSKNPCEFYFYHLCVCVLGCLLPVWEFLESLYHLGLSAYKRNCCVNSCSWKSDHEDTERVGGNRNRRTIKSSGKHIQKSSTCRTTITRLILMVLFSEGWPAGN